MTKPVTRKLAVDCLLHRIILQFGKPLIAVSTGEELLPGMAIEFDHVHADVHGGPHEYENLRPLPKATHKKKTKADVQANAKIRRIRGENKPRVKKRIPSRPTVSCGTFPKGQKMQSRPFQKRKKWEPI